MSRIMIIHPEGNINNNPNLTGIVEILCEKGYEVDIYSPRLAHMQQYAPCQGANFILTDRNPGQLSNVFKVFPVESFKSPESISDYITCNIPGYDLVIGVDRGIIEASFIAGQQKVPFGLISYEILFSEETGHEYVRADREASQGVSFAVCQDRVRSYHLSRENGIPLERIIDIPVAGRTVQRGIRNHILHEKLGLDQRTKIALYIGGVTYKWAGIDELIAGSDLWPDDWVLVLHQRYSLYDQELISRISIKQKQNIFLSPFPNIPFDKLHILLNAADLGLSFYIPQIQGNGFSDRNNLKYIGMASGKISTYLQHGLPIVTNQIGEMSEYVRNYNLGRVVTEFSDLGHLLESIDNNELSIFNNNCCDFFETHLDLDVTIPPLLDIISSLLIRKTDPAVNSDANNQIKSRKPMNQTGIFQDIEVFYQPPAGTTERYISVQPQVPGEVSSTWQAIKDYEIAPFGKGISAVNHIIAHIISNKLGDKVAIPPDFYSRTIVLMVECSLNRPSGQMFESTVDTLDKIDPGFAGAEGLERVGKIQQYAHILRQGGDLGCPLYISGTALGICGGVSAPPQSIFMVDGARRISATVLAGRRNIKIMLLMSEDEYASHINPRTVNDTKNAIAALSWFNTYQSIPLVGISGERSLTRFSLMDMTLLRDARIMDFGCNLGQACIKAVMAGASEVWGVEGMPDTYRIASEIGRLSGFQNLHYLNVDFNSPEFTRQIDAACPDQVDYSFFFSVFRTKELTQRDTLFRYIIQKSRKGIFFEGHADPIIDTVNYYDWLFESFGLTYRFLGNSEGSLRPLFFIPLAERLAAPPPSPTMPISTGNSVSSTSPVSFRVSAIVSTYAGERFIEGRLKDLLEQTLSNQLEIIVIDSNSPENERAIVERYAAQHSNIVYIRTDRRETLYQAWNRGARAARGAYLTNANTDDRLRPDALELLAGELDTNPAVALVYADFFITGHENMTFKNHIRTGYSIKPDYSPNIMLHGCHMGPQPMWRRSLHDEIGYFDETLVAAGDYEFWCRIACHHSMKHVSRFLGLYLHNPKGICNSDSDRSAAEAIMVQRKYSSLLPKPADNLPTGFYYREAVPPRRYVNIGMITFNRLEFTRNAIEALLINTDFPHTLTVIDNASTDGTREYLQEQKLKGVIKNLVLLDENVGVARASNLAWSLEPEADYYLKLDNDIVIQKPGWLRQMADAVDRIALLGAVAYNFEPYSYPLQEAGDCRLRPKGGNLGGACILIPRRTRERLGVWCEDYGLYSEEDADYGRRIICSGLVNAYMEDEHIGLHLPAGRAAAIDATTLTAVDGVEEEMHSDYRQWKDDQRRKAIGSGLLERNFTRYANDPSSLHVESRFATDWLLHHRPSGEPTFSLSAGMSASRLKVAVYTTDGRNEACPRIRTFLPFRALSYSLELLWGVTWRPETRGYDVDTTLAAQADLVVITRFFPSPKTVDFIEQLLAGPVPVVYDTDDLLTSIDPENTFKSMGDDAAPYILDVIRRAALVTVSNEELRREYAPVSQRIEVLPNMLDDSLWSAASAITKNGPLVIGYAGGFTHSTDLKIVEEALQWISQKYGDQVRFRFMGCATEAVQLLPDFEGIDGVPGYEEFAGILQHAEFDIAIAPLRDTRFNRCKSNIKWLEYSACGFAGVYSDLPPYNGSIEQGQTGLLVENTSYKWFAAIDMLISNPELRRNIAANARRKVLTEQIPAALAWRYLEAYRSVIDHKTKVNAENLPITENVPPASASLVSIVILTFNQLKYTRECLESIQNCTAESHEIIFVDNGSTDGTAEWLREQLTADASIHVIENDTNRGFAAGCNQGIKAAHGKYIMLLNNDTVVTAGWLSGLQEVLDRYPDAGIIGPMTNSASGVQVVADPGYGTLDELPAWAASFRENFRFRIIPQRRIVGFCMLFRREMVENIGLLDESFGSGNFEDDDFCLRAVLAGYHNMIAGDVFVHHAGGVTFTGNRINYSESMMQNMALFRNKWNYNKLDETTLRRLVPLDAIQEARRLAMRDEIEKSIELLMQKGIRVAPDNSAPYVELAEILIAGGRYDDALQVLPEMPPATNRQLVCEIEAICHAALGDDESARLAANWAAESPRMLVVLGTLAARSGDLAKAEALFRMAADRDPSCGSTWLSLGMLLWGKGNQKDAYQAVRRAVVVDPLNGEAVKILLDMAARDSLQDDALQIISDSVRLYPDSRKLARHHAELLARCGKEAEALVACETFLVRFGVDEELLSLALQLRQRIGVYDRLASAGNHSITLCMIVKNENKYLPACLASLKPVVNEMVVVDTGSSDRTADIAAAFGARVFNFAWNGNFSDARNCAIDEARGKWILVMDADEVLAAQDYEAVRRAVRDAGGKKIAWSVLTRNYTSKVHAQGWISNDGAYPHEERADGWHPSWKVRLTCNQPGIRFSGEVHEMIENSLLSAGYVINKASFVVHHYGGLVENAEEVAEKERRYFEIGMKKLEKNPNDGGAIAELAVQAGEMGGFEEAVRLWDRLLESDPKNIEALFNKGFALIKLQRHQEALTISEMVLELAPDHKEAAFNYGTSVLYVGQPANAVQKLEPLLQQNPEYPPLLAVLTLLYLLSGQREKAILTHSKLKALNYAVIDYAKARAEVLISLGKEGLARKLLDECAEIGIFQKAGVQ